MFNNKEVLEFAGFNKEAARYSMYWDIMVVAAVVMLFFAIIPFSFTLMAGDWDFYIDWRDRQFWPLIIPIVAIWYPAALGAIFWENFRLPIGGTVGALLLLLGSWLARWGSWYAFGNYPMNLITPNQIVAGGLILDGCLMIFRHFLPTAIFGGFLFGFTFYFANYGPIAGMFVPVEHLGSIAPVADVIGYTYPRVTTPEYLRIVERSTLRTFGDSTVYYTAAFAGWLCVIMYLVWWYIGRFFAQATFFPNFGWVKDSVGLSVNDQTLAKAKSPKTA